MEYMGVDHLEDPVFLVIALLITTVIVGAILFGGTLMAVRTSGLKSDREPAAELEG